MGNVPANAYKGKLQYYWEQARDTAADIQVALMLSAGNPSDGAVQDFTTLTALWASTGDEATFTNYARKTVTNPTVSIDNTLDQIVFGADSPISWTSAGGAVNNTLARAVFFYDPAPGSSTDTTRLPLFFNDIAATTDGTTLMLTINPGGLFVVKNTV
jgi:hypothetical protein